MSTARTPEESQEIGGVPNGATRFVVLRQKPDGGFAKVTLPPEDGETARRSVFTPDYAREDWIASAFGVGTYRLQWTKEGGKLVKRSRVFTLNAPVSQKKKKKLAAPGDALERARALFKADYEELSRAKDAIANERLELYKADTARQMAQMESFSKAMLEAARGPAPVGMSPELVDLKIKLATLEAQQAAAQQVRRSRVEREEPEADEDDEDEAEGMMGMLTKAKDLLGEDLFQSAAGLIIDMVKSKKAPLLPPST